MVIIYNFKQSFIILVFIILGSLFLVFPFSTKAVEVMPEIKFFDQNLNLEKKFLISAKTFEGSFDLTVVDLGGDGISEIVIGAPAGEKPEVKIYREDGSLVNSFLAYDKDFKGGVNVAAGDLDGDGKGEIITGAGPGGGPHIRIFDGYGNPKITAGFFAFDKNLRNGVNVAVGDLNGDRRDEIIAGSGPGTKAQIKIFKSDGELLAEINPGEIAKWSGVNVASGDLDSNGVDEVISAPGWGSAPQIQIWKADGTLLNKFLAYDINFKSGVNLSSADFDGDSREEIITGAGAPGGPHIKVFDGDGHLKINSTFFAYDKNFRGGVLAVMGKFREGNKLITLPQRTKISGRTDLYKYIEIDISEQKLWFYESGFKLGVYPVSTGMPKMPTPLGNFKIFYKSLVEYSDAYDLYMPHFMQFTRSGAGIHGLPYWEKPGGRIYEGVHHLGLRVSHGCVRLPLDAAEKIYEWAAFDTFVIVHQ